MKNRVITISREFGSGGRTIGKKVAEKLGIPCYDAEIIQEMTKETGFAPDYVKEAGEYAPGGFLSNAFSNRMFGPTNEDILWERQYKVITDLAAKGPCVIVGRCADYILQDILPVVLPVPGLGDAGHRAVFLHNHGDAVAVSKVCDLRIILPTNGQKRWRRRLLFHPCR